MNGAIDTGEGIIRESQISASQTAEFVMIILLTKKWFHPVNRTLHKLYWVISQDLPSDPVAHAIAATGSVLRKHIP
ncbi:hypothetical protein DBV39_18910 [Orrella marina]|uniref:Uncharacterized protein n=1 Tax=Orrella marina TaxID=2163011 RepID=A0A2R4XP58_9BURK|nr:hypothetical protein DBV39_18910 [Orrella marina]